MFAAGFVQGDGGRTAPIRWDEHRDVPEPSVQCELRREQGVLEGTWGGGGGRVPYKQLQDEVGFRCRAGGRKPLFVVQFSHNASIIARWLIWWRYHCFSLVRDSTNFEICWQSLCFRVVIALVS